MDKFWTVGNTGRMAQTMSSERGFDINDPQEFLHALERLYDSTVALRDATEELRKTAEAHAKRLDDEEK